MTVEKTGGTWRWLAFAVEIINLLVSGKTPNFTYKFQVRAMLFKFTKSRGKKRTQRFGFRGNVISSVYCCNLSLTNEHMKFCMQTFFTFKMRSSFSG